jgi:hypothetical protein
MVEGTLSVAGTPPLQRNGTLCSSSALERIRPI